ALVAWWVFGWNDSGNHAVGSKVVHDAASSARVDAPHVDSPLTERGSISPTKIEGPTSEAAEVEQRLLEQGAFEVRVVSGPQLTPVAGARVTFAESPAPDDGGLEFRIAHYEGELERVLEQH